jgi:hypothetical protein
MIKARPCIKMKVVGYQLMEGEEGLDRGATKDAELAFSRLMGGQEVKVAMDGTHERVRGMIEGTLALLKVARETNTRLDRIEQRLDQQEGD